MAEATRMPAADAALTRRDFLHLTTVAMTTVAAVTAVLPFIHQMNPSADTLAEASIELDLAPIQVGQSITVIWQKKPVFIRRRTPAEIDAARKTPLGDLKDPQQDEARATRPEWLILVGVCTHLGCVPLGQRVTDAKGDYGGWFCPCHGSHYDTAGRIRRGPAPKNLPVPPYAFLTNTKIRIG
jgi:ubiquinol-cytochrome c reductase iron-sulfur subunit